MIVVVYRWRLKPGMLEDFTAVWAEVTSTLKPLGSGGSALFEDSEGIVWGIARWPDAETRDAAFARSSSALDRRARFDACVAERLEPTELHVIKDLWSAFPATASA